MSDQPMFFGVPLTIDKYGSHRSTGDGPFWLVAGYHERFHNLGWALSISTCDWDEVVDCGTEDSLSECIRRAEDAARRIVREGAKQVGLEVVGG